MRRVHHVRGLELKICDAAWRRVVDCVSLPEKLIPDIFCVHQLHHTFQFFAASQDFAFAFSLTAILLN